MNLGAYKWWLIGGAVLWWTKLSRATTLIPGGDEWDVIPQPDEAFIGEFARAIGKAEGYFDASGATLPQRRNNPGSLTANGQLITFPSAYQGWQALYSQVRAMFTGSSAYYRPSMSIREIAAIYTGGDKPDAWARIVASELGVSPDTKIGVWAEGKYGSAF